AHHRGQRLGVGVAVALSRRAADRDIAGQVLVFSRVARADAHEVEAQVVAYGGRLVDGVADVGQDGVAARSVGGRDESGQSAGVRDRLGVDEFEVEQFADLAVEVGLGLDDVVVGAVPGDGDLLMLKAAAGRSARGRGGTVGIRRAAAAGTAAGGKAK